MASTQTSLNGVVDVEIEKLLKNIAEEEGFSAYKIETAPGSAKGDGHLSLITSIRITGTGKSNNQKLELNLILKCASKCDALRSHTPIANIFEREIYMYNVVIPAFQQFEMQRGLQPFSSLAKCYKTCLMEKKETLIVEDLKILGYRLWERKKPMDHEQIAFVMKEYGRFHALSFALRYQDPETFEKLTQSMDDVFDYFCQSADYVTLCKDRGNKVAVESLDPELDKKAFKVFKKFIDDDLEGFLRGLRLQTDKFSVIVHGDAWANNMLFQFDDEENPTKPTKMCLIDFQVSRIGSPVLDLSYFLYTCSSKAAITNIEEYLNIYHDSLSSYLKILGTNPDELYPYSVFRQQWKVLSKLGFICSTLLIQILLSEQNEVCDLDDALQSGQRVTEAYNYTICNSEVYNDRTRHNILHFVENILILL